MSIIIHHITLLLLYSTVLDFTSSLFPPILAKTQLAVNVKLAYWLVGGRCCLVSDGIGIGARRSVRLAGCWRCCGATLGTLTYPPSPPPPPPRLEGTMGVRVGKDK
ncbi:uncharacterized protein H6S33_011291 [Morchella sextelata]|uniref:uncharacterized protein n=1 Tax=Morchella sextelata TaxID=1174677 RepID=UPI001D05779D|nr:uncharacterized protein H6S33_011291 [Morchella sextelata]KAH0610864.1 hypothetical protein H6S33_011291 [Morchella sextelata]